MAIDTNELRRLAQEATHPVTKGRWMHLFGESTVYDRLEDGCRGIPVVSTPFSPSHPFEAACLDFIAAANPAAISELLDRLETAEKAADELASLERYRTAYNEWIDKTEWVQADTSLPVKYLGMRRADVLKDMISELEARCAKWEAVFGHLGDTPDECGNVIIAARDELEERIDRLESALIRIVNWDTHNPQCAIDYGSNGVRDYYRNIARAALEKMK